MVFKYNKMHTMRDEKKIFQRILFSFLRRWPVDSHHHCMVSLVWFQRDLLLGLHLLRLHLLHLPGKHCLGLSGGVDTVGLDRDDKVSPILEEVLRVKSHNPGLVRLSYISKHAVNHGDQHPVLVRVPGILYDWHHVSPLLGHVEQISARPVTELHCIHHPFRPHHIRHMAHCGATSSSQIQDLAAWWHVDLIYSSQDCSS